MRLKESKQVQLARKILESKGYKVSKNSKSSINTLESEIRAKVKEIMTSPEFGFEDDYDLYSTVEVYDKDEYYEIEVRAELSYEGMMDMSNALDPIVKKYDKDAYFDMVTSGIISAYIMK